MTKTLDNRTLIIAYSILLLSTLDFALTCYLINTGIGWESNPILRNFSLEQIGIAKTLGLLVLFYWGTKRPRALRVVFVVMALVCIWNTLAITGCL